MLGYLRLRPLFLCVALLFCLSGASCQDKGGTTEDPLDKKAREKYTEGRRLFLTCDPNKYREALELFEEALAYRDDYPEAQAAWAETLSMYYGYLLPEDNFKAAYSRAQRAVRLDPSLDMGYRAMADLYRHHRDPKTGEYQSSYADEIIDRALRINPSSAENLYVKGSIFVQDDPEKAIGIFRQAIKLNPNLGKTYFNMASANQMAADNLRVSYQDDPEKIKEHLETIYQLYDNAVEYLTTYQKMVPGDLGGYCSMGIVYMRKEMPAKASEMFRETLSRNQNPDPTQNRWRVLAYYQLAKIAEVYQGNKKDAVLYLERSLEIAPNNQDTLEQVIRILKDMGDKEAARKYQDRLDNIINSPESGAAPPENNQERESKDNP